MDDLTIKDLETALENFPLGEGFSRLSANSRRIYEYRLRYFLHYVRLHGHQLGGAGIEAIVGEFCVFLKTNNAKSATINGYISTIDLFCHQIGYRGGKFCREKLEESETTRLTQAELERLIHVAMNFPRKKPAAMLALLLFTGITVKECLNLKVRNIHFRDFWTFVHVGEGSKARTLLAPADLASILAEWVQEHRRVFGDNELLPLFPNRNGKLMSSSALDQMIRSVGHRANLSLSARIIRDSLMLNLIESGESPGSMARLFGLSKVPATALCYYSRL